MTCRPGSRRIPADSVVFGFGPMLPLVAAALGAWLLPPPWPGIATRLAVIWASVILAFLAGVRRGFGFGRSDASTPAEIATMLAYFMPAVLALVAPRPAWSLCLLLLGYALVILLDPIAAHRGDAPAHFARLRPPQIALALASLLALLIR